MRTAGTPNRGLSTGGVESGGFWEGKTRSALQALLHASALGFTNNGTLYLLATGAGSGACWPLVAALIEDLTETARRLAATSPGAKLDPPVLLALDEIGNLAPLPSLPILMAEGGGTGITTMTVLQSLAQARSKWREHAASTIWDSAIAKAILGGASASKDLQELSILIGERDERSDTISIGEYGARSLQRSTRRASVIQLRRRTDR